MFDNRWHGKKKKKKKNLSVFEILLTSSLAWFLILFFSSSLYVKVLKNYELKKKDLISSCSYCHCKVPKTINACLVLRSRGGGEKEGRKKEVNRRYL